MTAYVPKKENGDQGVDLAALYRNLDPGDTFMVIPIPTEKEPNP